MRLRHKAPTLVSMWMLDVFCCALGCVILLLLLKMREANYAAAEVSTTDSELRNTQWDLLDSEYRNLRLVMDVEERDGQIARVNQERDDLARQLALVQRDRDDLAKSLALVRTQKDDLAKKLALIEETIRAAEGELVLARKRIEADAKALALAKERSAKDDAELAKNAATLAELAKKIAAAEKERDSLQVLVREKEKLRTEAVRQALDLNERLIVAESKLKNSEKVVDDLMAKSTDAGKLRNRVSELERQVADANVTIVDLQGTKAKLADRINKLVVESEQRFAGIAMTGKNVVFLVDISGSMIRTDENSFDPAKWPIVCDTLAKVMRSLPDLEQYQVILFSSKASYLLGNEGRWLTIDRDKPGEKERTVQRVHKEMLAVKVNGDTNMFLGLNEAFKFRKQGMDTIYLFSDGLPTSGPGLTDAEERANLSETERSAILSRYLRRMLKSEWNRPDARQARVRINSIGFFYESPDVGAFLWALSRENDGSFVGMSRP